MPEIYLSDRQVAARYGVHHLTPRRWVREDPSFPRPVKLSPGFGQITMSPQPSPHLTTGGSVAA